ncbi:MAG: hypothetical protein ACOC0F_01905 [archaeon]
MRMGPHRQEQADKSVDGDVENSAPEERSGHLSVDPDPPMSQLLYGRERAWTLCMLGVALGLSVVAGAAVTLETMGGVPLTDGTSGAIFVVCVGIGLLVSTGHAFLNDGALGSVPLPVAPGLGVAVVAIWGAVRVGSDLAGTVGWALHQLLFLVALGAFSFAVGLLSRRIVATLCPRN